MAVDGVRKAAATSMVPLALLVAFAGSGAAETGQPGIGETDPADAQLSPVPAKPDAAPQATPAPEQDEVELAAVSEPIAPAGPIETPVAPVVEAPQQIIETEQVVAAAGGAAVAGVPAAAGGALVGAAVGTLVAGPVGTIPGAIIGGVAGGALGGVAGGAAGYQAGGNDSLGSAIAGIPFLAP